MLNEIFLPILEMKSSTVKQKSILLAVMSRLCHDPQALVEIYINYDCDRESLDNVYERLINIISRIGTIHYSTITPANLPPNHKAETDLITASPASGNFAAGPPQPNSPNPASSSWTAESAAYGNMPYEARLKRQSLEALVFCLRSLVSWAGKGSVLPDVDGPTSATIAKGTADSTSLSRADLGRLSEDERRLSTSDLDASSIYSSRYATPDQADDPTRFETAKQKKTILLEGIKKFNFKQKRVSLSLLFYLLPANRCVRVLPFCCKPAAYRALRLAISPSSS